MNYVFFVSGKICIKLIITIKIILMLKKGLIFLLLFAIGHHLFIYSYEIK